VSGVVLFQSLGEIVQVDPAECNVKALSLEISTSLLPVRAEIETPMAPLIKTNYEVP